MDARALGTWHGRAMMVWLGVFTMSLAVAHAESRDPTQVPREERIAVVNALFESHDGAAADAHYRTALERFVGIFDPFGGEATGPGRVSEMAARRWLSENEYPLIVRFDRPAERVPHIDQWLKLNDAALAALRQAAESSRWYRPFSAASGRLADIDLTSNAVTLRSLVKLRAIAAARLGYEKRWEDAARESAAGLRLATHARGRPLTMWQLFGDSYEAVAIEQLVALVPQLSPDALRRLQGTLRTEWAVGEATDDQIAFAEGLFAWDTIERYHAWAQDEAGHESVRDDIGLLLRLHDELGNLKLGEIGLKEAERSSFASVDAFKAELLKTSPQASWRTCLELEAAGRDWEAMPLPKALRDLSVHSDRVRAIGRKDPVTRLWNQASIFKTGHVRFIRAKRDTRRAGLGTLIAIHLFRAARGAWPASLDDLTPELLAVVPVDPFSGKPLIYRRNVDAADFVLFSVGENQQDDSARWPSTGAPDGSSDDLIFRPIEPLAFKQPDVPN